MSTKIDATERRLNLVIALLGTRRGHSKHFIRNNVNGYARVAPTAAEEAKTEVAFERMFERDKETLREVGIPITTITSYDFEDEEQSLYRINPAEYQVPEVRLDEPAMTMLAVAANLWAEAAFGEAAQSALRKVATRAGLGWFDDDSTVQSRIRTQEPAFEPLWTALRNSNPVRFSYRAAGSTETAHRTVHPWGLGSKYGQWYLAGFDTDRGAPRHFRLSRIRSEVIVAAGEHFDRPADFTIASVLDDLGTGPSRTALVEVPAGSARQLRNREGTLVAAAAPGSGRETLSLEYREPELMADDLAALGAAAYVLEPEELRTAVTERLRAAAAAAANLPAGLDPADGFGPALPAEPPRKKDPRERLVRLLSMVPFLVANPGIDEAELASEFGLTPKALAADLDTLSVSGLPGYLHGDLMDVTTDAGQVFIRDAETLGSPLRLTQEEACALLVGLQALAAVPGTREADSLRTAIDSLRRVAGRDAWLADDVALELVSGPVVATIARLQALIHESGASQISYLVRSRDELTERVIEPRRIFSIDSTWYVRAWCRLAGGLRNFRVDHIGSMTAAGPALHGATADPATADALYTPGTRDQDVLLLVDEATARRLAPAYGASLHRPLQQEVAGAGLLGMRILVGEPATLAPLMARLGGHARVLLPAELRTSTSAWLAAAAGGYDAVGESTPGTPGKLG
ncbi:hypothetical protein AL755_11835 [Arthrobacter sp. ERGS1:01]|nr:hypothetical protein AL755_11835 [Arthrobacter sp. ERGS1:01]